MTLPKAPPKETGPSKVPEPPKPDPTVEVYKLLVEMADRVSQRRQAANNFYLSVNSGLIGASAYLSTLHPSWISITIVAVAGVGISLLWIRNIGSYKTLNEAKFRVIHEVEKGLPFQPFAEEWTYLDPKGSGSRHRPFHTVEIVVPWVFVAVHAAQVCINVPWPGLILTIVKLLGCGHI